MNDLIEALQIFAKYKNEQWPTHCEHDVLMVVGIDENEISSEDKIELERLSFNWSNGHECWISFRFGSA